MKYLSSVYENNTRDGQKITVYATNGKVYKKFGNWFEDRALDFFLQFCNCKCDIVETDEVLHIFLR